ncbi:Pyridine nucleotide-disulfide oxidoreductase, FAD/NAD(P)-binding domain containing protein [Desulfovibrio sp. X2]|uniref:NAD(P)/FAD-dependent oxidoreductase n=1 Tax=Desulfovibrio sp. X2 TaxID=941449 RepID=UPI0003587EEC|nr:NAD(P)/FAD-dependent oxidoreductase [Desulfovibrio sp. X2]EPR37558.1 Pyridine nucleotide-disulfide oxidoreductase, FAD/NAD(P)-binding domain containing protein [Desulfovibrio sp. X2]
MTDTATSVELCIVGAGPAGISAAIYAGRAGISAALIGCTPKFAGDYEIDNYFGFPETITGRELEERGLRQAARFGIAAECRQVLNVHAQENGRFEIRTADRAIDACALILATGVTRGHPNIPGLADFEGKGVSYCVSCDGYFVRGKPVVVVGEGNFAANQALDLLTYTHQVTLCLHGKPSGMDAGFTERLAREGISVVGQAVAKLEGGSGLERVVLSDGTALPAFGLFVAMGEASSGDFAQTLGLVREGNFIAVDREQTTNVPGVFAAGDCTGGFLQISKAVGEGAVAARSAIAYVKKQCRKDPAGAAAKGS